MKLNLADLTQAMVDEATPNMGIGCTYAAPCILGTLIPADERGKFDGDTEPLLDEDGDPLEDLTIATLAYHGFIEFEGTQLEDAMDLQGAFDMGDADKFEAALAKRGLTLNRDLLPVTPA